MKLKLSHLLIFSLIVSFVLAACGSDEPQSSAKLEGNSSNDDRISEVKTVERYETSNLYGKIVYTKNRDLYLLDSEKNLEQQRLAVSVDMNNIYFSPSQQSLIYATVEYNTNRPPTIYNLNLATQENRVLVEMGSRWSNDIMWQTLAWSPNREWLLVDGINQYIDVDGEWFGTRIAVVRADGSERHQVTVNREDQAVWLADNRVLVITRDMRNADNEPYISEIFTLDPVTLDRQTVSIDTEALRSIQDLNDALAQQDFELAQPLIFDGVDLFNSDIVPNPVEEASNLRVNSVETETSTRYCRQWQIQQVVDNEPSDIIYQTEDVASITDLNILSDGAMLFIQWSYPECEFLQTPVGELVYIAPNGEASIIADELASILDRNNASELNDANRYAVSPDEQFVTWIEQDETGRNSQLNVTTIKTGDTQTIDKVNNADYGITTVYWVRS